MSDLNWARHYNNDNLTALFLKGERQDLEEVRIIEALSKCTCLLVVGMNDPRRQGTFEGVPNITASSIEVVPHHLRHTRQWISVYAKDGTPLNGGQLRMAQARALARDAFDLPEISEYGAA